MAPGNLVEYDRRSSYFKFATEFILILLVATGSYIALKSWQLYQGQREVAALEERMQKAIEEREAAMRADMYGGATPQETLRLYIDAVEAGDYELASKYFVLEKQDTELESLNNSLKENIQTILKLLKQDLVNMETQGSYSDDRDGFAIRKPLLVDFKKYPNGVWKIIEI